MLRVDVTLDGLGMLVLSFMPDWFDLGPRKPEKKYTHVATAH